MESEKRPGGQRDTGRGTAPRKAVFLDRDGTMNTEVNYLHNPGAVSYTHLDVYKRQSIDSIGL